MKAFCSNECAFLSMTPKIHLHIHLPSLIALIALLYRLIAAQQPIRAGKMSLLTYVQLPVAPYTALKCYTRIMLF